LRFPPILRIDAEIPAAFQDRIRNSYPLYKSKPALKLPAGFASGMAAMLLKDLPAGLGQSAHEFTTLDETWTVALTRDFLALTCKRYSRWENFKEQLSGPLTALLDLHGPSFFSRIGLRYRDLIRRSVVGLDEVPWAQLLRPEIAGVLADPDLVPDIEHTAQELFVRLPDGHSQLHVHHGLAASEGATETCYLIDADFFTSFQTEPSHALGLLDFLNKQSRHFFRWCITDRLHQAMGPEPLPAN
jgi:uncharacterized protein (TIGR04255 family)